MKQEVRSQGWEASSKYSPVREDEEGERKSPIGREGLEGLKKKKKRKWREVRNGVQNIEQFQ